MLRFIVTLNLNSKNECLVNRTEKTYEFCWFWSHNLRKNTISVMNVTYSSNNLMNVRRDLTRCAQSEIIILAPEDFIMVRIITYGSSLSVTS